MYRDLDIEALAFDVFGTVVDWRSSVSRQVSDAMSHIGVPVDTDLFADRWREGYHSGMARINAGEEEWKIVDRIHRERLDFLLEDLGVSARLEEEEKTHLNRAWERLDPWRDSVAGLTRMKTRFVIAALSNGNVALLTRMAKHAGLPWDCVLSSELAGCYKPDVRVYIKAADLLGLSRDRVMMVAAHVEDLNGAQAAGLRTAFVARPEEFGPDGSADADRHAGSDMVATDFNDLADQLGC